MQFIIFPELLTFYYKKNYAAIYIRHIQLEVSLTSPTQRTTRNVNDTNVNECLKKSVRIVSVLL